MYKVYIKQLRVYITALSKARPLYIKHTKYIIFI